MLKTFIETWKFWKDICYADPDEVIDFWTYWRIFGYAVAIFGSGWFFLHLPTVYPNISLPWAGIAVWVMLYTISTLGYWAVANSVKTKINPWYYGLISYPLSNGFLIGVILSITFK